MEDTRGWRPKNLKNDESIMLQDRVMKHFTKTVKVSQFADVKETAPASIPLDNMGNSVKNNGRNRSETKTIEVTQAPDIPLSSYEGVEVAPNGGIVLDSATGYRTALHAREMRDYDRHVPVSSARLGSMETTKDAPNWTRARLPMGPKSDDPFMQHGEAGVEDSKDDEIASRGETEFRRGRGK